MEIKFIGNGSGFSKTNNNAFFEYKNELIIIDVSMLNMNKIKEIFDFKKYKKINIFITHMHADHISGLPNLIQYLNYTFNIVVNVISPYKIKKDIITFLNITGVHDNQYKLKSIKGNDNYNYEYLVNVIETPHSDRMYSYGYVFNINKKICVYTGDTRTLNNFNKYLDSCDEAYIDTSYNSNKIHVSFEYLKNNLPKSKHIYLMHVDEEEKLKNEVKDLKNVEVVKIYER